MDIKIRKAIETDIIPMTSMYNESIRIFPENIRKESNNDQFVSIYNSNIVYIAEQFEKQVGWLAYNIQLDFTFIAGLYILTNKQRKGIGTKLLEYCIEIIKKNNCQLIILNSLKIALWSIEFYKKNGFEIYNSNDIHNKNIHFLGNRIINDWELLIYKHL